MSEAHIVTPEEAQEMLRGEGIWHRDDDLAHTVATEPDRVRAAVFEALVKIKRYAEGQAITEHALGHEAERHWLDVLRLVERAEKDAG